MGSAGLGMGGAGQYSATGSGASGDSSVESNHGLFTCPILGPMLGRRFNAVWWDVDGIDAVCGISQVRRRGYTHQMEADVFLVQK